MTKFNQRLKVLLFLPLLLGSVFLLFKYSRAQFSDSETVLGNSIQVGVWGGETTPTPVPVNPGDVVINELMWMGSSKGASDEWIELRNTTGGTINISGWQLTKWVKSGTDHEEFMLTIPGGSTIPAGGFFLIAQFPSGAPGSALNVEPDVITTSVVLSNTDLQIKLFVSNWDSGGTLIDTAGDKSTPLKGEHETRPPKKFYSMERSNTFGDGAAASSWYTATVSVGFDPGENIENRGTPKSVNSTP